MALCPLHFVRVCERKNVELWTSLAPSRKDTNPTHVRETRKMNIRSLFFESYALSIIPKVAKSAIIKPKLWTLMCPASRDSPKLRLPAVHVEKRCDFLWVRTNSVTHSPIHLHRIHSLSRWHLTPGISGQTSARNLAPADVFMEIGLPEPLTYFPLHQIGSCWGPNVRLLFSVLMSDLQYLVKVCSFFALPVKIRSEEHQFLKHSAKLLLLSSVGCQTPDTFRSQQEGNV